MYVKSLLENSNLQACLETLENAIDPQTEEKLLAQWLDFTFDRFSGDLFHPARDKKAVIKKIPSVYVNDTLADEEQGYINMALAQFAGCLSQLAQGSGSPLSVRCNYGVGIMPSLFGCDTFYMKKELNTLPNSLPLKGENAIEALVKKGIPDIYGALGGRVFKTAELFKEIARQYPKIGQYVFVYHPDIQGPMDIAELIWGSDIFMNLLDEPQLCHDFLSLITETYILFFKEWEKYFPSNGEYACHWSMIHKGTIMLRNDSAMNLSPAMVEEFILPYDQILFNEFGGGAMHFCGRGDHYIDLYSKLNGIHAINLTQPQYNNMETILKSTVDRGIKLLQLDRQCAESSLQSGRLLHGCVSI